MSLRRDTRFAVAFGGAACLLAAAYFIYAFQLPQTPARMARASADLIPRLGIWSSIVGWHLPVPSSASAVAAVVVVVVASAFALYALAVCLCWRRTSSRGALAAAIAASVAFFLIAAWSLPNLNTDIYNYIVTGRVAAAHGSNPYAVPADRFPADPVYGYAARQYTSIPGDGKLATWTLIGTALAKVAGDDVLGNLLVFRFAFLLFSVGSLLLVVALLRRLKPDFQLAGVVAFGWNPIVVIGGQTKVDTVMVFFMLLGALLVVTARRRWAVVCFVLSGLVKLITLPLAAVYSLRQARHGNWRELAIHGALATATAVAVYVPFHGAPNLISRELGLLTTSASSSGSVVPRPLLAAGFVACILWAGFRRDDGPLGLLRSWGVVMLYFSAFMTIISMSWYLMVLVAVTSVAADWRLITAMIALTFGSFLINTWESVSSGPFPLGAVADAPRAVVYLVPVCALATVALVLVTRQRRAWLYQGQPQ